MEGVAACLRRARENNLIEVSKPPPPPPLRKIENDENQVPVSVLDGLINMKLSDQDNCRKLSLRVSAMPDALEAASCHVRGVLTARRAPPPPSQGSEAAKSATKITVDKPSEVEAEPTQPGLDTASPVLQPRDLSECEIVENAFLGLPGMEAYRDTAENSDDEAETKIQLPLCVVGEGEDGDEEVSEAEEDSDEDSLLTLAGLIATTKKLSLGRTRKSSSNSCNNNNENVDGRKNRNEVREKFIGQNKVEKEGSRRRNNRFLSVDLTRQSVSEMSESDFSRHSEVILTNFPLLPEKAKNKGDPCKEEEVFSPTQTNREEQKANDEKEPHTEKTNENDDVFFLEPGFSLFSSSEDEKEEKERHVPPTPPNTPYVYEQTTSAIKNKQTSSAAATAAVAAFASTSAHGTMTAAAAVVAAPPPPLFRRSSVVYTPKPKKQLPPVPLFRRSSACYSPSFATADAHHAATAPGGGFTAVRFTPDSKKENNSVNKAQEENIMNKVPLFRRSSVVYTPEKAKGNIAAPAVFDVSSVKDKPFLSSSLDNDDDDYNYSPSSEVLRDSLTPTKCADFSSFASSETPPKMLQEMKARPPKTEAIQKTKSRIEMASPLVGMCQGVPSAQLGVHLGSLSVPAKSKTQSRFLNRRLIAIADTNVLLKNLNLVENTQNYPNVTLIIPSVVVRELDGLKRGSSETAREARVALHSLRKLVKGGSRSTIKFQNIDEVPQSRSYRGRGRSNDDRILDCCLYYAEMADSEQKVVLLTNDVALQIKADSMGQASRELQVSAMGMRAFYEREVWFLA